MAIAISVVLFIPAIYWIRSNWTPVGATEELVNDSSWVDSARLSELINRGADVNAVDSSHEPVLVKYVAYWPPQNIKLLLDHGAKIHGTDSQGNSALHKAAEYCNLSAFPVLCADGTLVNLANNAGQPPLLFMLSNRSSVLEHIASGKSISTFGDDKSYERNPAVTAEYEQGIKMLLDFGANPNLMDYQSNTPLHYAASSMEPSLVKLLLDQGSNVNVQSSTGDTPLLLAVQQSGNDDTVRMLLQHGADAKVQNKQGQTPLYFAKHLGYENYSRWLRQAGATR